MTTFDHEEQDQPRGPGFRPVSWDQSQPRRWKRSVSDSHLLEAYEETGPDHLRAMSTEGKSKSGSMCRKSLSSHKKHSAVLDNAELPSQFQTIRARPDSRSRPSSLVSIAKSEANLGRDVDNSDVLRRISRLLQSPVTSTSEQFSGPDGKPLGVEVAINAYQRGEYSTGDIHQDLLPLGLYVRHPEYLSSRYYGDDKITQPCELSDLYSLYAAATDRKSIALSEMDGASRNGEFPEDTDTNDSFPRPRAYIETQSLTFHGGGRSVEDSIETVERVAGKHMQQYEHVPDDSDKTNTQSVLQNEQEVRSPDDCQGWPSNAYFRLTAPCSCSPKLCVCSAAAEGILSSKGKLLPPLPIFSERLQKSRLRRPQSSDLDMPSSFCSDQSLIHPALRTPVETSRQYQDRLDEDGHGGPYKVFLRYSPDSPSSSADSSQLEDRSASPSVSTVPTSVAISPSKDLTGQQWKPRLQDRACLSGFTTKLENSADGCEDEHSLPSDIRLSHLAYNCFAHDISSSPRSPSSVKDFYRTLTKFEQGGVEESYSNGSSYSLRRMLAGAEGRGEPRIQEHDSGRDLLSISSPFAFTDADTREPHAPQVGEPLPGTMLGGLYKENQDDADIPNFPRHTPIGPEAESRNRRRRQGHPPRQSTATPVADETYLRAQAFLHCQRTPVQIQAPIDKRRMTYPSHRPLSQISSKLNRFFGEDFKTIEAKAEKAARKEQEHDTIIRQLLGGSKRTWSGVSEDVKKGLKRLLG